MLAEATPFSQVGTNLGRTLDQVAVTCSTEQPLWAPPAIPCCASGSILLQRGRLLYLNCHLGSLWLKWSEVNSCLESILSFSASKMTSLKLCAISWHSVPKEKPHLKVLETEPVSSGRLWFSNHTHKMEHRPDGCVSHSLSFSPPPPPPLEINNTEPNASERMTVQDESNHN